jgi:hypothetical protein
MMSLWLPQQLVCLAYFVCCLVKFLSRGSGAVVGGYSEIVSVESWNYVHVEVTNLLLGLTICQEKVDSFTSQARLADSICHLHGDLEQTHACFSSMLARAGKCFFVVTRT